MRTNDPKYKQIVTPRPQKRVKVSELPEHIRAGLEERFEGACRRHDPFTAAEKIGCEIIAEADVPQLYYWQRV